MDIMDKMMADVRDSGPYCYCGTSQRDLNMLRCDHCKRLFHTKCLKSGKPSVFDGDLFFTLVCANCSETSDEECTRMKLQWLPVVMLALYNLQMSNSGNRGYFRWKEQICTFIDQNWTQFFGHTRKKTTTWHGTVAGVLSSGCPQYFQSGTQELRESGWWRLTECKPPPLDVLSTGKSGSRKQRLELVREQTSPLKLEGLRSRAGKTSIQAAMELRAKRDSLSNSRENKRAKLSAPSTPKSATTSPVRSYCSERLSLESASTSFKDDSASRDDLQLPSSIECTPMRSNSSFDLASDLADQSSQMSFSSTKSEHWFTVRDLVPGETVPDCLLKDDEEESDLEIDPCALSPDASILTSPMSEAKDNSDPLPQMEDILASLESKGKTKSHEMTAIHVEIQQPSEDILAQAVLQIKQEPPTEENSLLSSPDLVTVKQEPVSEDSNTFDSTNFAPKQNCFLPPAPIMPVHIYRNDIFPETIKKETTSEPSAKQQTEDEEGSEAFSSDDNENTQSQTADVSDSGDAKTRRRKRKQLERDQTNEEGSHFDVTKSCIPMSLYEEKQLLKSLNSSAESNYSGLPCDIKRLRRKLLVRQMKREHGQKLFDIDNYMNNLKGMDMDKYQTEDESTRAMMTGGVLGNAISGPGFRILDRFQSGHQAYYKRHVVSFLNRLVGSEDDQLLTVKSPYTARVLKPFIRRDYESRPLKLKLLQEIKAYPHRQDTAWVSPPASPIDYCYVRPQHIPSVNTLCREFFWPGIDLSECLQYPDFSCVVLYRKFVIGFAFMVPDVKYNEAYISFIFTHPEWRGAGIGTFMLYHLIQTCMGKDVTLHVSASNPAMMLYQKFGFKSEEFILDFYEKYYPEDNNECRHAFFLRLRR